MRSEAFDRGKQTCIFLCVLGALISGKSVIRYTISHSSHIHYETLYKQTFHWQEHQAHAQAGQSGSPDQMLHFSYLEHNESRGIYSNWTVILQMIYALGHIPCKYSTNANQRETLQ